MTMNEVLSTIILFWATILVTFGSIASVVFLVALTGEFLETHFGIKFRKDP